MTHQQLDDVAKRREHLHRNHKSSRPLSKDYQKIGLAGEIECSRWTGIPWDHSDRPGGDGGKEISLY